jgi:hypothetical protein
MITTDRTPHIVLALLPDAVQARLDGLRRAHYPPERNRVPAHCTLFHAVPGMVAAELAAKLATLTAQTPPPRFHVTVQNKVDRRAAHSLQADLAASWHAIDTTIPAIAVHRVVDGLWQPAGLWAFRGANRRRVR